jgi:hypothetical protein
MQQPQLLGGQIRSGKDRACDVAARMVEAGDEAIPNWIATANEDDRNRCGCGHDRARCNNIPDDHGRLPTNEIGRQPRQTIRLIVAPAIVDGNVLALDKSGLLQALLERDYKMFRARSRCTAEESDHGHG